MGLVGMPEPLVYALYAWNDFTQAKVRTSAAILQVLLKSPPGATPTLAHAPRIACCNIHTIRPPARHRLIVLLKQAKSLPGFTLPNAGAGPDAKPMVPHSQ
jgi:hypothetical protein